MGYFLQLRILLWKNLTLKKRTPLVLCFEICIPLTLFVVLLLIRRKQPPKPVPAGHYTAQPLPSAGLLAIMQQFCENGYRDPDGFAEYRNNSLYTFLGNLQALAENNNFFDPGFSPDEMNHIPELYRSIIDDPAMLHDTIIHAQDVRLEDVFTDSGGLKMALETNFSLSPEDVNVLFNSHINYTEVYNLLFGSAAITPGDFSTRHKRAAPNSDLDHGGQNLNIPSLPTNLNDINLDPIRGVMKSQLPDKINSDSLKNIMDSGSLSNKIPDINPFKDRDIPSGFIPGNLDPSQIKDILSGQGTLTDPVNDVIGDFGHGLVYDVLRKHPELLLDPEFRDVISAIYGLSSGKNPPDPTEAVDILKKIMISSDGLRELVCGGKHELTQILIPADPQQNENLLHVEYTLCNMSDAQWQQLSVVMKQHINSTDIVQKLHLNNVNYTVARHRIENFKTNLQEFINFEKNMMLLSSLAADLPLTECQDDLHDMTTVAPDNTTDYHGNSTEGGLGDDETQEHGRSRRDVSPESAGLAGVWIAMQRTVCGHVSVTEKNFLKYQETRNIGDLGISEGEKYRVGILAHALYSNPRVLYAPNDTSADNVMNKANETFALIDLITEYASRWLNVSSDIRAYLEQNRTQHNLESIKEMQHELRGVPSLVSMIHNATIQDFIMNKTVPDADFFLRQLDIVDNTACGWLKLVEGLSLNVFKGFRTEEELVDYFLNDAYSDGVTVFASVVFTNLNEDGSLPPHIEYKIRQNASFTPTTRFVRDRYWHPGHGGDASNYYKAGFVWIQDIVERAMVDVQVGRDVVEPGSYIWEVSYPCYMNDQFLFMIEHVMPLVLTVSWVYAVAMLVQNIVYEKEQRLKEVMRMMGLNSSVHWLAWFITTFTQMSITMAILTVILKYGQVLHYSNVWIIFLVLEVFAVATIAFSFLVSVCYSKAKVAAACAGIVYFLTYVPYMYIAIREEAAGDKISAWTKSIASLFSTTAFGLGAKYFAFYEIEGVGVQWENVNHSPVEDDQYNLFLVTLMMVIDALIYGILTWYIENVHPGSYGLPKPWYFPVTKSYWWGHAKTETEQCSWRTCCRGQNPGLSLMEEDQACAMENDTDRHQYFESEPSHLTQGVCIDNLTKIYKTGKLAVNKLSLNLYEDQITSFLGHNGAGKTTTMSILTGLFPPSGGDATVYNNSIRSDMEEIRKSLGMCPQHNVLFDKLTVEEHLWFYARLKGMAAHDIKEEMECMIQDVGLPKKRHSKIDCLSGGMQRKLSVAIAFVAGSRTVILDEPTAGVDPYARRAIWDLLIKYKKGRTILLSTHHMDEADILGDRIAIISNGQIKCCGSSLFLKNMFGDGYHLMLVKKPSDEDLRSMDTVSTDDFSTLGGHGNRLSFHTRCTEAAVTSYLTRYIPTTYLQGENVRELHYILPFEEAKKGSFERLFQALDRDLELLHVSSYGVMDTSLEEVFLKVTEQSQNSTDIENETNESKEIAMCPTAEIPVPIPQTPTDNQDENSLTGGSILLGSNNLHDLELGTLAAHAGPRSHHEERLRAHGHQRSWSGSYTPNRPTVESEAAMTGSFIQRHRRSVSGSSWTARLAQVHQDREIALNTPARGHRRAWSGSSWSRLSQFNGPIGAQVQMLGPGAGTGPGAEDRLSVQMDDALLQDGDHAARQRRGHQRDSSVGSDVSLLGAEADRASMTTLEGYNLTMLTGQCLYMQQFLAVIFKRYYFIKRNWRGLFSQILLPALFVCIAMTVALTAPQVQDLPAMEISPSQYYNYTQPNGNYIPYMVKQRPRSVRDTGGSYWWEDAEAQSLVETFHMPAGMAATCVLKTPFDSSFDEAILKQINMTHRDFSLLEKYFVPECASVFAKGLTLENFLPTAPSLIPAAGVNQSDMMPIVTAGPHSKYYPECHCDKERSGQVCSEGGYVMPPEFKVITADHLQDISGQSEEQYYLYTYDMYRLNRYGGFSMGKERNFVPPTFGEGAPTEYRKLAVHEAVQVRFSSKGYHSMPIHINTLNNAILRANLPPEKGNPSAYGITAINHPMNNTNNGLSMAYILQGSDVLIAIFVIVAMSFVPASFVVFLVYERSIKAKHLQIVSGMNRVVYWISNLVWDMGNFLIPATCCILILRIFNIPAYVSGTNFPAVISLFLLYGWSITPMMYPATFWFKEPSTAYISLIVINLFIGITCIITSFLLELFQANDKDLKTVHDVLKMIFLVFPNYCLGRGLMDIAFNEYWNEYFFKTGQYGLMKSPFEWTLMARNLVAMAIMGFVFFLITLLCEFNFFYKPRVSSKTSYQGPAHEDVDISNERKRVLRGRGKRDMLRLENLTQIYVTRQLGRHLAVDRLCLGVPQGECFGLLGVNGAGKTTTFKMLTGDLTPTGGDAVLNGKSILKDIHEVQQMIGYCPQFDALYDELTAREHLRLYARLRGVPHADQNKVVEWALRKLGLMSLADNLSMTYSGGNKRKLSCAIALIGNPPVIFLDEPTTGMDPHSRRFLWDLILSLVEQGRSVILTSHSMEECEALCTRMAIMVNGQFKCLGSAQHLKSRFGDGYTISVRVKGPHEEREVAAVKRFIEQHFPLATLKEKHHNLVQYELPSRDLSLSTLFSKMEDASQNLNVEDYSVSQNTLDNVFINFVKQQQEIVQESCDAAPSNVTSAPSSPSSGLPQNTELRPLLADTDNDALLDIEEGPQDVRSRLTFLDSEPINC